jgi:hypothetical protein
MQNTIRFSGRILGGISGILGIFVFSLAAAEQPVRIMPLGDSITAGYTDNSAWTVPFGFGYRSGLYTRLTGAGTSFQFVGGSQEPFNGAFGVPQTVSPPDLRPLNQDYHRGYGGWGADGLNGYIGKWLNSDNPDVILLMIGINNIGQGSTADPTTAKSNLNALVSTIFAKRPNISLIVAQITPYATYTSSIVQYNDYIKNTLVTTYANQGRKISTVDQYSNFLTDGGAIDSSLYSNGINHPNATGYDRMAATWYSGLQALGPIAAPPASAVPVLQNGNFETSYYTSNTHNINPGGALWTFSPSTAGAGSGIDQGNPYGAGNSAPASGDQMAFLQGLGGGKGTCQIVQNLTGLAVGKTYRLSFQAKGISGFSGANPFSVSLDGTNLSFGGQTLLSPAVASSYTSYTAVFAAASSTMSLRFYDAGNVVTRKVSWIDNVKLGIETPSGENLVANGGFETPALSGVNAHSVNAGGAGWRFSNTGSNGSGMDRGNYYGSTNGPNAAPFAGSQYAFLQGRGSGNGVTGIEQDVPGFQVGASYRLTFEAASIEGSSGADPFYASIGETPITFQNRSLVSPSASYGLYISDPFVAADSTMTLRFFDAGNVPVGQVSWLDDVQITYVVPEPATCIALLSFVGWGGLYHFGRRRWQGRD